MKYPVLAIDPSSFICLMRTEAEMKRMPMFYIGIFKKRKDTLEFFDSDGGVWKLESVAPVKPLALWHHLLPSIRDVDVNIQLLPIGPCPLEHMKAIFRKAVEADDDLLTQHHEGDEILAKLVATKSIGEIFRLYRWMMKDFREGPEGTPKGRRKKTP